MAGVQAGGAGSLNIEVIANIAKLQQDMARAEKIIRSVEGVAGSAGRGVQSSFNQAGRAASKMAADAQTAAAGAKAYAGDVARLKAALDPAWQAQQRFNQQQELAMRAFKSGAIDREQFVAHMRAINSELKGVQQPMQRVTSAAGAQKAGMQQLSFQLNDVATMFAMGAKPMQIFASQSGQVIQAVQLMTGGTSKLATFLGGPWGMAITAGAMVLVPLIGKLFDTADAANSARFSLDGLIAKYRQVAAERNRLTTSGADLNKLVVQRDVMQGQLDMARRNAGSPDAFAYDSRIKKIDELNKKIAEGRAAIDAERAAMHGLDQTAGQLLVTLGKKDTATQAATTSSRSYAGAMRDASADAQKYALDMRDVISGLIAYKMAVGEDMQPIVDAINAGQAGAMGAKLQADLAKGSQGVDELYDAFARLREVTLDWRLGDVFGDAGDAIEGTAVAMRSLADASQAYENARLAIAKMKPEKQAAKYAEAEARWTDARNAGTIALLGSTKRLFKEESAGYKVITALEMALAGIKMVNTIKGMAMDAAATSSSVANSTTRAAADQAAGASKMFSQLGVWAFPVVAAMVAVLASLGVKGGGGGSASYKPPSADDMQARTGTGTVLGDSKAQSESIQNALDIIAANTNSDLEFSNESVGHLRDIATGINKLTGLLGQQFNVSGGAFDTSSLRLGSTGSGGFLGIGAKSTTRELYDQGIELFQSSVADVLAQGIEAQVYNVIQQVKKSSGFLGIGGSTKTTYQTVTGELPGAIQSQMQAIIGEVSQSVISITRQLGLDVASFVNNAQLPQVRLSFKDMSGDEIESALQAYFSSVADQIAAVAGDAFDMAGTGQRFNLADLQRAGEGLFETLSRIARTMMTVDSSLRSIGMGPLTVGGSNFIGATAPAADNLVGQFGDLDTFQDAVAKFADAFLTEAERMQPIVTAVRAEMDRLGLAGVTTNDAFKSLVLGLDVGTSAGRDMFAQLMVVAPAFAKVTEYLGDLNAVVDATGKTAEERARIDQRMAERAIEIMELEGRADEAKAARRMAELAGADALEHAQIKRVHQLQDEAAALSAATAAADKFNAVQREGRDLQIRLAAALGDTAKAEAMRKEDFLNSVDPLNRAAAELVWSAEKTGQKVQNAARAWVDHGAGMMAHAELMQAANDNMVAANDNLKSSLQQTVDKFRSLSDTLREFRDGLFATEFGAERGLAAIQGQFNKTAGLAASGNADAMAALPGLGRSFLDQARMMSSTALDYQRQVMSVIEATDAARGAADNIANDSQSQLDRLESINEGVEYLGRAVDRLTTKVEEMDRNTQAGQVQIARNTRETHKVLDDVSRGGFAIRTEAAA